MVPQGCFCFIENVVSNSGLWVNGLASEGIECFGHECKRIMCNTKIVLFSDLQVHSQALVIFM